MFAVTEGPAEGHSGRNADGQCRVREDMKGSQGKLTMVCTSTLTRVGGGGSISWSANGGCDSAGHCRPTSTVATA